MSDPRRVRIVSLSDEALEALAAGDLDAARAATGLAVGADLVSERNRSTWRRRVAQVAADPSHRPWVTGLVVDAETGAVVGRAGFHGPPDDAGMVELGYATDPEHRRRGYARATVLALLARAETEPHVRTVRASVSPDNEASLATIAGLGFREVGEQWDDEDGLETVYERRV